MPIRRPASQAGPEIGIFSFIQEPGKVPALLGSGVAIGDGERYGDYINYPREHSQYWPEIKQRLPPFSTTAAQGLATRPRHLQQEDSAFRR